MIRKFHINLNEFANLGDNFEKDIIERFKDSDKMSFEKFLNFNSKKLITRYNQNLVEKKHCNCNSTCCSGYCCVKNKYENVINCFFKNYSIFYYQPDQIDPITFSDNVNVENVNRNFDFTIYDTRYAIPRLITPFAIMFAYKTTGNYANGGITIRINVADSRINSSNQTAMEIQLNLPQSNTLKYYTVVLPCLTTPAKFSQGLNISFDFTDDVIMALSKSISNNNRNIWVATLYHVLVPFNVFAVRSLAGACAFYQRFTPQITKGIFPSPYVDSQSNLPILEYFFKMMRGLSNGVGQLLITQLRNVNMEQLMRLKNILVKFLQELRRYAVNISRLTRYSVDDFIANNASNQVLDLYISNAMDYIGIISNAIKSQRLLNYNEMIYNTNSNIL